MGVSVCTVWSNLTIFCLFIKVILVTSAMSATSNSTASWKENSTNIYNQDNCTPTEPSVNLTKLLPEAPQPLPDSGSLPLSVVGADRLCPCDENTAVCDMNCCCDRECNMDDVALFTSCTFTAVRSGSKQLCSQDVAGYSLTTGVYGYLELQSSVQREINYNIFCVWSQNRFDGLSHPSPSLPTAGNFDSLFSQFVNFIFDSEGVDEGLPAEVQALSGYQFGDVLATAEPSGQKGIFYLPAPGVTADCVNSSPAVFLKDQTSRCSQRLALDGDCSSLQALRMDTYTNVQLLAGRNADAAVVHVDVASVILQSIKGAQTELTVSNGENLLPVLTTSSGCANMVLKAVYVIKYNSSGELVNARVSLVLGFVNTSRTHNSLQQEFQVIFQADGGEPAVYYSGNPGYVVGMPLMSGDRATEYPSFGFLSHDVSLSIPSTGISRSINLRDTLSLLQSTEDQDCLQGPHQRSPVLFGQDYMSGCTLSLEDITNCSLVSQSLLNVLRGPSPPQYVASFGNTPLENILDWVPVKSNINPTEAQSCKIPLSLHLEIEWTKYGSLVNPQAQIVTIREMIETNQSSLARLSGGSSIVPVRSSVAFIPVSAAAVPGYRAAPSINAKLPFDFFFPFV
ncbi:tectonic-1 isoform X2 [Poecilia reticulata]|uniref:tectonic-1 isoform X2 n=1 Tax=Poecilia reticulata TaxID=8081 RepID=UPI0004A4912C|nr:PREDICTED: tectonic-1 isoform X2 [Poecilia reticulata]